VTGRGRTAYARAIAVGLLIGCPPVLPFAVAGPRVAPRSTAELLVDRARDHGLLRAGRQTPADVLHLQTLLRAALRLEPNRTDALTWLYELAALAGDPDRAAAALSELVAADAHNQSAFALWLASGPPDVQTVEQRIAWLESRLEEPGVQPWAAALIHVHLARLALQRADLDESRRRIARAQELYPACPEAAFAALQAHADAPPLEHLRLALRALESNPGDAELAWRIGTRLDELGQYEPAARFYRHALDRQATTGPGERRPAPLLLQFSRNAVLRGDDQGALDYARLAAEGRGRSLEPLLYSYWLAGHYGQSQLAAQAADGLGQACAAIRRPDLFVLEQVAQAAWFYCTVRPDAPRALELARYAATQAPDDPFVTRVLGWAQALNGQGQEARQTLAPIASRDPYAAYQLVRLLRDAGESDAAEDVLRRLEVIPPVGHARDLLDELGLPAVTTRPAAAPAHVVQPILEGFQAAVLDFFADPGERLRAEITLDDVNGLPGEPWRATLALTNRADYPIWLGAEGLVNPVFLLSFTVEGDRRREYPALLQISVDRVRVLLPGESVRVRQTLDVGPLSQVARQTPQQLQRITLTALLDPVRGPDGAWRPGPVGQALPALSFLRLPARTGAEAWHATFAALASGSPAERFDAVERMAELLGEAQRHRRSPLNYRPEPLPEDRVHQALLAALSSESWELRARTLDALQVAGLDAALVAAVQENLKHPHWLVRLLALRLLARQGEAFAATARRIVTEDEDELVRAAARSTLMSWERPASQPTSARTQLPAAGGPD